MKAASPVNAFRSKTAIVSGLTSEYAGPLVHALLGQGARLALVESNADVLYDQLGGVRSPSGMVSGFVCDAAEASVRSAYTQIQARLGAADMLVTCPPARACRPTSAPDLATFRDIVSACLDHAFVWSLVVGADMRQRRTGVIVHVTGLSGLGGWRGWGPSGAAFAAIHNLVQSMALEYAADGVRVNGLIPGVTQSMAQAILEHTPTLDEARLMTRIPQGRWVSGEALGAALLYLVQPAASYVSGEMLTVDGGWDMWGRLYAAART